MVLRESGLTEQLNQGKPLFGFTDTETVKLDLDDMSFGRVKYWACKALKQFGLGGFLILKSSKDCYHVVFDRSVDWSENASIVAWVCLVSKHRRLTEWLVMQLIKRASTLRISAKQKKSPPRIVYSRGSQDGQITGFLEYRRLIKSISKRLFEKVWEVC